MLKKLVNISYSVLISLALVISIAYYHTLWWERENYTAGLNVNYINAKTMILFLILTCLSYIMVKNVGKISDNLKIINNQGEVQDLKNIFWKSLICNLLTWGIWFMVFAPGAGMNDTINIFIKSYKNDNCPFVYQILIWYGMKLLKYLIKDMAWCYGCLVCIQMLVSAIIFASVISWLSEKNVKKKILYILIAYYSLLPVIADYSITLVKDTLYAVFLLKFMVLLYDIVNSNGEFLKKNGNLTKTVLVAIAVCCFRSNGTVVCICSLIVTLFVIKKNRKRFLLLMIVVLVANTVVGHLEEANYESDAKFRESTGVLMAQIGAVLNDPAAKIDEKDLKNLNKLLPIETWKENYRPSFADYIKLDKRFDNDWLNQNKISFIKIWFKIMLKNFPIYVKAYICHSYGYWGLLKYPPDMTQSYFTSINNNTNEDSEWGVFCEKNNLLNQSMLPQEVSAKLENLFGTAIMKNFSFTPGAMMWLVFLCVTILFGKKMYVACVPYLPIIFTWGTMMIASPASLIYRYSYYLVLALPIVVVMTIMQCIKRD